MGNSIAYDFYKSQLLKVKKKITNGKVMTAKLVLEVTIIEGIGRGVIKENRIYYDGIAPLYTELSAKYNNTTPLNTPFVFLSSDGFFHLRWKGNAVHFGKRHSLKLLRESVLYAYLEEDLWTLLQDEEVRREYAEAIEREYLIKNKINKQMATKYSDLITLRSSKAAYNIEHEEIGDWQSFIANDQFNAVLRTVLSSVLNDDISKHKSFWIEGTYGTGKSHASAVIKHLLCDDPQDIKEWVDTEYDDPKKPEYQLLRNKLMTVRKQKRLFPVTMYGQNNMGHQNDLSLAIQKAVSKAICRAGLNITTPTDFERYARHIETQRGIWDSIYNANAQLRAVASNLDKLVRSLRDQDISTLRIAEEAAKESGITINIDAQDLCTWFIEVQNELRKEGTYQGLLLIWDEFTDVARGENGSSVLVDLQELNEACAKSENDSYLLLIMHQSALNNLDVRERDKTKGRYHVVTYDMEPVSAFKIMSRKLKQTDRIAYYNCAEQFYNTNRELYELFSKDSSNPANTMDDLKSLFPLHPATANLATYYAREVGSSSRSVFEFLGANDAIKTFLDDEAQYAARNTITADYLWDYVLPVFQADVTRFGVVTERYNSYHLHVEQLGAHHLAVFKVILLLNALNNLAHTDTVTPSEENIRNAFKGTSAEGELEGILEDINNQSIIQRDPNGVWPVEFSALPLNEVSEAKERLREGEFKLMQDVAEFKKTAYEVMDNTMIRVNRANEYRFYGVDVNEPTLANKIVNGRNSCRSYELFFAFLLSRTYFEEAYLKEFAEKYSPTEEFENIILVVPNCAMGDKDYDRFIEYVANWECAGKHGNTDQQNVMEENAREIVWQWIENVSNSVAVFYLRGEKISQSMRRLQDLANETLSPRIYKYGPESLAEVNACPRTCWKSQAAKITAQNVLTYNTKREITEHSRGNYVQIVSMLQNSADESLNLRADVDPNHPLKLVCDFVDNKIKNAKKGNRENGFNAALQLAELRNPPYGFYKIAVYYGMLAFALRKYVGKLFDSTTGKSRTAQHLVDDVVNIFEEWEKDSITGKVIFKFQTREEGSVCNILVKLFELNRLEESEEISSLQQARWALTHEFLNKKGYPLWALKYSMPAEEKLTEKERNSFITNICAICDTTNAQNPAAMNAALGYHENYKYELREWVENAAMYEEGFGNFLKTDTVVNIQDEEIAEATDYIRHNLNSDVGLWSENEVKESLKNWRISTQQKSEPSPSVHDDAVGEPSPEPFEQDVDAEAVRQRVAEADETKLRAVLYKLIDNGRGSFVNKLLNDIEDIEK